MSSQLIIMQQKGLFNKVKVWVWFLTKRAKICLKRVKYLKNLTNIIEERQNLGIFSIIAERASIGTMGPEQISSNYKNNNENKEYFLPFDELAAPFFGEKESIISVKNKLQFVFNLFFDTIKKLKKAVCQFVCVLELKRVFFK